MGPLSGPALQTVALGLVLKILHYNSERILVVTRDVLCLVTNLEAHIIFLQEMHSVPSYSVAAHHHHKQNGIASYIREGLSPVTVSISGPNDCRMASNKDK